MRNLLNLMCDCLRENMVNNYVGAGYKQVAPMCNQVTGRYMQQQQCWRHLDNLPYSHRDSGILICRVSRYYRKEALTVVQLKDFEYVLNTHRGHCVFWCQEGVDTESCSTSRHLFLLVLHLTKTFVTQYYGLKGDLGRCLVKSKLAHTEGDVLHNFTEDFQFGKTWY